MTDYNISIDHMIEAAQAGGRIIANYFGETLDIEEKLAASDVRTKADTEAEAAIIEILRTYYPDYDFYAEESGDGRNSADYSFVIDPLDGSNNFTLGIPYFSVSIALMYKGILVAAVIYQPITNKTYHAQLGKGAFADSIKLQVSNERQFERATVTATYGYTTSLDFVLNMVAGIERNEAKRMLHNWSTAMDLCLLAEGRIEAITVTDAQLYDIAAGRLIASEAGAIVSSFSGEPVNDTVLTFLVSNMPAIHQKMLKIIRDAGK